LYICKTLDAETGNLRKSGRLSAQVATRTGCVGNRAASIQIPKRTQQIANPIAETSTTNFQSRSSKPIQQIANPAAQTNTTNMDIFSVKLRY
jgi:hypothetical protein